VCIAVVQPDCLVCAGNALAKLEAAGSVSDAVALRVSDKDRGSKGGGVAHDALTALQHFIAETGADRAANAERVRGCISGSGRTCSATLPTQLAGANAACDGGHRVRRCFGAASVRLEALDGHEGREGGEDWRKQLQQGLWVDGDGGAGEEDACPRGVVVVAGEVDGDGAAQAVAEEEVWQAGDAGGQVPLGVGDGETGVVDIVLDRVCMAAKAVAAAVPVRVVRDDRVARLDELPRHARVLVRVVAQAVLREKRIERDRERERERELRQ
jgi:hypothetical protein